VTKLTAILKAHWPAVVAFGVAAYAQFGTAIAGWVHAHPKYAVLSQLLTFCVGYYMKSPLTKPPASA
jgi:hypothetical protein